MFKALSMFGLGGAFLMISPELRGTVMADLAAIGNFLNEHSPFSYFLLGLVALGGAMIWVYRAAQPRC
jgi:hypothetical protein